MKKIIILLISFTFLVFWSCSKEDGIEQEEYGPGPIIKSNVIINIKNKDGKDLLNPSTAGYLPFEQMKLYYLIKGKKNEVYDPNMAVPRGIKLITTKNPYQLAVSVYSGDDVEEKNGVKKGISITYLEFNSNITDTIKTEWEAKEHEYYKITKFWYNNKLYNSDKVLTIYK